MSIRLFWPALRPLGTWSLVVLYLFYYSIPGAYAQRIYHHRMKLPTPSEDMGTSAKPKHHLIAEYVYHTGAELDQVIYSSPSEQWGVTLFVDHNSVVHSKMVYQFIAEPEATSLQATEKVPAYNETCYSESIQLHSQRPVHYLFTYLKRIAQDSFHEKITDFSHKTAKNNKKPTVVKDAKDRKAVIPELDPRELIIQELSYKWDQKNNWAAAINAADQQPHYDSLDSASATPKQDSPEVPPFSIRFTVKLQPYQEAGREQVSGSYDFQTEQMQGRKNNPYTLMFDITFNDLARDIHNLKNFTATLVQGKKELKLLDKLTYEHEHRRTLTRVAVYPHFNYVNGWEAHDSSEVWQALHFLIEQRPASAQDTEPSEYFYPLIPHTIQREDIYGTTDNSGLYGFYFQDMIAHKMQHGLTQAFALKPGPGGEHPQATLQNGADTLIDLIKNKYIYLRNSDQKNRFFGNLSALFGSNLLYLDAKPNLQSIANQITLVVPATQQSLTQKNVTVQHLLDSSSIAPPAKLPLLKFSVASEEGQTCADSRTDTFSMLFLHQDQALPDRFLPSQLMPQSQYHKIAELSFPAWTSALDTATGATSVTESYYLSPTLKSPRNENDNEDEGAGGIQETQHYEGVDNNTLTRLHSQPTSATSRPLPPPPSEQQQQQLQTDAYVIMAASRRVPPLPKIRGNTYPGQSSPPLTTTSPRSASMPATMSHAPPAARTSYVNIPQPLPGSDAYTPSPSNTPPSASSEYQLISNLAAQLAQQVSLYIDESALMPPTQEKLGEGFKKARERLQPLSESLPQKAFLALIEQAIPLIEKNQLRAGFVANGLLAELQQLVDDVQLPDALQSLSITAHSPPKASMLKRPQISHSMLPAHGQPSAISSLQGETGEDQDVYTYIDISKNAPPLHPHQQMVPAFVPCDRPPATVPPLRQSTSNTAIVFPGPSLSSSPPTRLPPILPAPYSGKR